MSNLFIRLYLDEDVNVLVALLKARVHLIAQLDGLLLGCQDSASFYLRTMSRKN